MITRKRRPLQSQLYQRSRASLTSPVRSSYTYKSVTRKPLDAAPQLSKNRPQTSSTPSHPTSTILWSISARRLSLNQRNLNQFSEKEHLNMSLGYLFLLAQTLLKLSSRSNNRRQPSLGNWKLNAFKYLEKLLRRKFNWWRVSKLRLTVKPEK